MRKTEEIEENTYPRSSKNPTPRNEKQTILKQIIN